MVGGARRRGWSSRRSTTSTTGIAWSPWAQGHKRGPLGVERMIGQQFEKGLAAMKTVAEAAPRS